MRPALAWTAVLGVVLAPAGGTARAEVPVDLSAFRAADGVGVDREGDRLTLTWPSSDGGRAAVVLDLRPGAALIESVSVAGKGEGAVGPLLRRVDPVTFVTVGSRRSPPDRPAGMSVFNVFFDSPGKRPSQQYRSKLAPASAALTSHPGRAEVAIAGLTAGPFSGSLHLTVYAGAPLLHVEAVVSTAEKDRAFLYDAGLAAAGAPGWSGFAWFDTEGRFRAGTFDADTPIAVRHRAIVAEAPGGSLACFPPPHQYFFPRDLTDNQKTVWAGRGHRGLDDRPGFGVRQTETGGGNFVPWFNAPPGTAQRLGVFYLLSRKPAAEAAREVLAYTRGDRFADLPGRVTFTSHWHMATAVAAAQEAARGRGRSTPDFVPMFRDMNVNAVHLAEFHGDGHPRDPGPLRLAELQTMFDECRRLSGLGPLFLPGEEANSDLAGGRPGVHTGHWLYLFPHPVYWTMSRAEGQPPAEDVPPYGKVYHVGGPADVSALLEAERGLAWTAHPRIKGSNFTPDAYRGEDFYRSSRWLGAAWKAMPADLSSPRLGRRVLDLFDDMENWGARKQVLGEVDVFKVDHTHELYAHMNVNYLELDRLPKFDEDWSPVLDALRGGRFFVTTGEVLLDGFTVGGQPAGATLGVPDGGRPEVKLDLRWTFPMRFAEVISGDGRRVYRDPIDLSDTGAFGRKTVTLRPELSGRTWVRVEAWDVAGDGAFSQPVWLEPARAAE